ncbi:MAG: hypothetical protein LBD16_00730 [Oscillospiraceae bacterium]|jgi:hypothetical protein|nr:hypothetical protein [Oscillospiraceae bacterium]
MKRTSALLLVALILIGLTGCGSKSLSGEYIEESNGTILEFRGNHVTVDGFTAKYTIKDNIFTILYDGRTLDGVYDAQNDTISIEGETYSKTK